MSGKGPQGVGAHDDVVVRKAEHGWVVGEENVSDLTSAMVLADLFAADRVDNDDSRARRGLAPSLVPSQWCVPPSAVVTSCGAVRTKPSNSSDILNSPAMKP